MKKKKLLIVLGATTIIIAGLAAVSMLCTNLFGAKHSNKKDSLEMSDKTSYTFNTKETPINNLDVEFAAGDLTIRYGDYAKVDISGRHAEDVKCYVSDGTLIIGQEKKGTFGSLFGSTKGFCDCIITLPVDFNGDKSDITLAAGTLTIEGLRSDKIHLEVAAGDSKAYKMEAESEFACSVGAGKLEISDSSFGHSSFEVGAGKLSCSNTTINGNIDLECGMGATSLNLNNPKDNFIYEVECGLGSVDIDGEHIGGSVEKTIGDKEAPYTADIECGLGSINVSFNK